MNILNGDRGIDKGAKYILCRKTCENRIHMSFYYAEKFMWKGIAVL